MFSSLFGKKEEIDVKGLVKQGAVIVDVRSEGEFASGHVKGAINIPLDELSANIKNIGDKDQNIIVCCLSGGRAGMAKNILQHSGYNNVHNAGGWQSLQIKLS